MSVLIYDVKRPEIQIRVASYLVVKHLLNGWGIAPYSALKMVKG